MNNVNRLLYTIAVQMIEENTDPYPSAATWLVLAGAKTHQLHELVVIRQGAGGCCPNCLTTKLVEVTGGEKHKIRCLAVRVACRLASVPNHHLDPASLLQYF